MCQLYCENAFFFIEIAQLANYDSGTAATPETDESVSVSILVHAYKFLLGLKQMFVLAVLLDTCFIKLFSKLVNWVGGFCF